MSTVFYGLWIAGIVTGIFLYATKPAKFLSLPAKQASTLFGWLSLLFIGFLFFLGYSKEGDRFLTTITVFAVLIIPSIYLGLVSYTHLWPEEEEEKEPNKADTPLKPSDPPPPDYSISAETRCSHQVIIGGSGSGKTTLLLEQIAEDMQQACSLVVFDSEGDIYKPLLRVQYPRERVVLIDPTDPEPISLSLFQRGGDEERSVAASTELITFALDAINNPLTPPMKNMLRFVVRLALQTPDPSIHTLREIFTDFDKYAGYVDRLPDTARAFFKDEFKTQKLQRDSLTQRIFPLADRHAFARMFGGTMTLDLYKKLDEGSLILINSSSQDLGEDGYVFFTRFMVYLIYQTIQERDPLEEHTPVYLYLDESKQLIDQNIVNILEKARKRRLGLILAFQTLPQSHLDELLANTAIKAVAYGVTPKDARLLADSVESDSNTLTSARPYTFLYHVKGKHRRDRQTDKTALMKLPRRTDLEDLIRENRERYASKARPAQPAHEQPSDDLESLNKA